MLHKQLDVSLAAELVVHQQTVLLEGPELEADVELVGALEPGELGEGVGGLEGDGDGEGVADAVLRDLADILELDILVLNKGGDCSIDLLKLAISHFFLPPPFYVLLYSLVNEVKLVTILLQNLELYDS